MIIEVIADSPAQQAGLQPGDRLLLVDGQSTERLTAEGVFSRLRGEVGERPPVAGGMGYEEKVSSVKRRADKRGFWRVFLGGFCRRLLCVC